MPTCSAKLSFLLQLRNYTLLLKVWQLLLIVFIDIHHNTSLKSILEDNSISSTFKIRIRSCLGKGAGLWLVVRPFICLFHITHFIFTSTLHFHLSLIQPLTSNIFMNMAHYMERVVVCPYVKNFITSQFLHDLRAPSFHCQCDGYRPNMKDNGFKCH
jgi:hypothetical protein